MLLQAVDVYQKLAKMRKELAVASHTYNKWWREKETTSQYVSGESSVE
jgi:hypothetical protein